MREITKQTNDVFEPIIVADIGGTNARFALVTGYDTKQNTFILSHQHTFPSNGFHTFQCALAGYLKTLGPIQPKKACFAVAGPIKSEHIHLTNLGWEFSTLELKDEFGFIHLKVINDFAAFAYATPYLDKHQNIQVKKGNAEPIGNIAVLGPGTGFGAACLVRDNHGSSVLSCEAGHITLSFVTDREKRIIEILRETNEHLSIESVFSGPGITRLYLAMCRIYAKPEKALTAEQISASADECEVCDATLDLFCDWIGSVAGDIALTFGGVGGVYMGGGILPRMSKRLLSSQFSTRFSEKGLMFNYLKEIPVTLVVQDNIPLIGAAACLHRKVDE